MAENDNGVSGGKSSQSIGLWVRAMRAPFFTAAIVPVILGASVAYYDSGAFNLLYFILTTFGVVLLHAGGNMANDYFDFKSGADQLNKTPTPFSGGSRVLVDGLLKPGELLAAVILTSSLGLLIGLYLTLKFGAVLLVLALLGVFGAYAYSAPPLKLAYRGMGEVVVAIVFGPLIVIGSYYVQTGGFTIAPVAASPPIAILIAAVLYINEFPDYAADKLAGKNQLIVIFGPKNAVKGYLLLLTAAYLSIVACAALQVMPAPVLLGLLTLPGGLKAYKILKEHFENLQTLIPANALTIKIHLQTGLLLCLGYIVAAFY